MSASSSTLNSDTSKEEDYASNEEDYIDPSLLTNPRTKDGCEPAEKYTNPPLRTHCDGNLETVKYTRPSGGNCSHTSCQTHLEGMKALGVDADTKVERCPFGEHED